MDINDADSEIGEEKDNDIDSDLTSTNTIDTESTIPENLQVRPRTPQQTLFFVSIIKLPKQYIYRINQ